MKRKVEDGRDCGKVLTRFATGRAAIDRCAALALEDYLESCPHDAVSTRVADVERQ